MFIIFIMESLMRHYEGCPKFLQLEATIVAIPTRKALKCRTSGGPAMDWPYFGPTFPEPLQNLLYFVKDMGQLACIS